MREILFKAKSIDNGKWVEGFLYIRKDGVAEINHYDKEFDIERYTHEVDSDTICQYTGLTDKNGNKIWENDVVRFDNCSNYPIVWDNDYNAFGSCYYSDFDHLSKYRKNTELEVIGNIFDNPELIEEYEHEL